MANPEFEDTQNDRGSGAEAESRGSSTEAEAADGGRDDGGRKAAGNANLEFILDIPLEVTVELGRTKLLVSDLLKLGQGSVIELTKLAGETLEILANQKPIARGEVVVVNDKYGIRLTEVISPMERVERLK